MKKPHIIILMHYLELGGAEMALIGLLHALDPEKVDVDLFIYSHQGPLMKYIPEWVNLLPEKPTYSVIERPMTEALKRGQFGVLLGRLIAKYHHKIYSLTNNIKGDDASLYSFLGHYLTAFLPSISSHKEYDLCISFLLPHNYGLKKVNAKKHIAWIHTDYTKMNVNHSIELPIWESYDYIASISESVTKSFIKVFPTLTNKIIKIENILSTDFVKNKAIDIVPELEGSPKLLSIGRYSYAKNYDNVPQIANSLVNNWGFNELKWYIIGYGDDTLIKTKIAEANMQDHVILLGKKENPYPYIKECDIYVQPSRYEGNSVTVREAQVLCKPVVVTNYPTAASQINDGIDGIIVPLDNESAAKGIADFISNAILQNQIIDFLKIHDYGNTDEAKKIYQLLNID